MCLALSDLLETTINKNKTPTFLELTFCYRNKRNFQRDFQNTWKFFFFSFVVCCCVSIGGSRGFAVTVVTTEFHLPQGTLFWFMLLQFSVGDHSTKLRKCISIVVFNVCEFEAGVIFSDIRMVALCCFNIFMNVVSVIFDLWCTPLRGKESVTGCLDKQFFAFSWF